MKKLLFSCAFLIAIIGIKAQTSIPTHIIGDVYSSNVILSFEGDLEVEEDGFLHVHSGSLYVNNQISGEENIQLDEAAMLYVDKGVFTFLHEKDERIHTLDIGVNGRVEVQPENSLTITDALTNRNQNTTDSLAGINLYANADGYAQLMTPATIAEKGTTYAQQYLTSKTTSGWRELSSPVATTLADVADDYPLYFASAQPRQWNIWWYDSSPIGDGGGHSGVAVNATSAANAQYYKPAASAASLFNETVAYSTFVGGSFFPEIKDALDVRGEMGNGDYTYTIYKTHDMGYSATVATAFNLAPFAGDATKSPNEITGWNLIPNPYPSNIDVSSLFNGADALGLAYKAIHVLDAKNKTYQAISYDLTTAIDWNNDGSVVETNIAPFQAFWVKADLENGGGSYLLSDEITLKNTHRTIAPITQNFFKTIPAHITLRVANEDTTKSDATIVALDATFDDGFETIDALKMKGTSKDAASLSTLVDGYELSINRVALPTPSHAIPVRFENEVANEKFFIDAAEYEIPMDWVVTLFDWKTKKFHNFKEEGVYYFNHDANFKADNRFVLHINYKSTPSTLIDGVAIWGAREGIEISFTNPEAPIATVEIMDLAGRRLYINNGVPTNQNFTWFLGSTEPQMYIVRVTTLDKHKIERVLR
jgi:hypothetical protein